MGATFYYIPDFESLVHHGTKGMHWGERRYQNKDGSLTPEGYKHWGVSPTGGKRITSAGRAKNAIRVANAMVKRDKQQKKLDKAVEKAEKTGDKIAIAEAKRNAKAFRDQGKGFVKSMNTSLKGTTSHDVENYLAKSNVNRKKALVLIGGVAGLTVATIATGGIAAGVAAGGVSGGVGAASTILGAGTAGMAGGAAGSKISSNRRNRRIRSTIDSLSIR